MAIILNPLQGSSIVNPFGTSGTYIIRQNITFQNDVFIHSNVTIIFEDGGRISGNHKLVGNNTRLIAPISQIFGESLKVEGHWTIDKAYPQWFSSLGYRYVEDNTNDTGDEFAKSSDNWAPAINSAIKMKGTGEVMIPRGLYYISSPINVNFGITLTGESGRKSISSGDNTHAYGTCIDAANGSFQQLIIVNEYQEEWNFNHPIPVTKIKNLELRSNNRSMTGIKAFGACVVDTVVFNCLSCGIHFVNGFYSDARQVYNCVFGYDEERGYDANCYAIDCECLGDALSIKNNHVGSTNRVGALRLRQCGGGVVSSNIFNADVRIESCKNVIYECNHMEVDAQLFIVVSNVSVRRNYFEKRKEPNIVITGNNFYDESVVDLEGNTYNCYEYSGRMGGTGTSGSSLSDVSIYDVSIDQHSIVNIKDEYRYWGSKDNMGKMYTFGIQIQGDGWNADTFNSNSHIYSKLSYIIQGKLSTTTVALPGNVPQLSAYAVNSSVEWLCPSGTYRYKTIVVNNNSRTADTPFYLTHCTFPSEGTNLGGYGGVLFLFSEGTAYTRNVKVQITRQRLSDSNVVETKTITLYVCGARYLYDNGLTISGYKWIDS